MNFRTGLECLKGVLSIALIASSLTTTECPRTLCPGLQALKSQQASSTQALQRSSPGKLAALSVLGLGPAHQKARPRGPCREL